MSSNANSSSSGNNSADAVNKFGNAKSSLPTCTLVARTIMTVMPILVDSKGLHQLALTCISTEKELVVEEGCPGPPPPTHHTATSKHPIWRTSERVSSRA